MFSTPETSVHVRDENREISPKERERGRLRGKCGYGLRIWLRNSNGKGNLSLGWMFFGLKTLNNGSARTSCGYFSLHPYDKPFLLSLGYLRIIALGVANILINYRQSGCGSDEKP